MKELKNFILKEIIFTFLIGLIAYILFQTIFKPYYYPVFWIILAVVFFLTALLHYSVIKAGNKEISKFSTKFMMITGIKMMIYLIFITTYVLFNPEKAKIFLISFFIIYLLYTLFEVMIIIKHFKKN